MDWRDTPAQAAWRTAVRAFLRENLAPELTGEMSVARLQALREDRSPDSPWQKWRIALAERGWVAPAWPKEYGGAGMTVIDQFILNQEFAEARAPRQDVLSVGLLGPTLITHGTEEQKREHLPPILAGTRRFCQGYSEPGAGSDLASLATRAARDGDDFVVNGQKIWTSLAHMADWMFCLVRTDPDAPKHRGITYLLIDMKSPGITIRPLVNMAGSHEFNEVFFEDVRVPMRNVVGEINRGWYVGATTLDFERSAIGSAVGLRQSVEQGIAWLREHRAAIVEVDYRAVRGQWAERWIEVTTALQLSYRVVSMQAAGQIPNAEASCAKLFASELTQRIARTTLRTLGMAGLLMGREAPMRGLAAHGYLRTVSATIAGGTSEIQRGIIAGRGLGLPRG